MRARTSIESLHKKSQYTLAADRFTTYSCPCELAQSEIGEKVLLTVSGDSVLILFAGALVRVAVSDIALA